MKLLLTTTSTTKNGRRAGAALLLSLLILLILVAIVIQINVSTGTDARIGRNDVTISTMDLAAESALLQCAEALKSDSESDGGAAAGAPGGAAPGAAGAGLPAAGGAAGAGAPPEQAQPVDSRRDEWATPQRTEINEIQLRIITQDENSKYNVLNMLGSDEKESEAAFERVVRILDACREGTQYDIDPRTAEEMAKTMREHMLKRPQSKLPRPKLLTDDEKNEDLGLPTSLREFLPLEPFEELHFKDFRDQDQHVVHSIATFLTVWSSLQTNPKPPPTASGAAGSAAKGSSSSNNATKGGAGSSTSKGGSSSSSSSGSNTGGGKSGAGSTSQTAGSGTTGATGQTGTGGTGANGQNPADPASGGAASAGGGKAVSTSGGFSVNVNTAPSAVLKSLFDSREVPGRFWDKVIEYRNLEDQEEKEKAKEANEGKVEEEEQVDEYGEPVIVRQIFKSVQDLSKVDGWADISAEYQTKITQMLTVQSEVFSVFVIARKTTSVDDGSSLGLTPAESRKREETRGDALMRVIHSVYWRQKGAEETKIIPVVRWEVLDYLPYEVLDFPPEDR